MNWLERLGLRVGAPLADAVLEGVQTAIEAEPGRSWTSEEMVLLLKAHRMELGEWVRTETGQA